MTDKPPQPVDENQIIAERRAKLAELRRSGAAFPNDFAREQLAGDLHAAYGATDKEKLESLDIRACVAGRMMLKRVMGRASFATIQDMSARMQLYVSDNDTGAEAHAQFKHFDLGDILGARGILFKTKTGELSIRVTEVRLLVKALRPLPEKFHGLTDQEQKYRQRHVDLIMNEETREVFRRRSLIIGELRAFMVERGFLEVETPMMQPIPGGAAARPFVTHHNALDMNLYLRIAPELYLKRLVVGGLEKVFEINRNFRNEGISTKHNPEFTMLEFYEAYRDYRYLMDFTQEMLRSVARRVLGTLQVPYGDHKIDFERPFERLTIPEAIRRHRADLSASDLASREALAKSLDRLGIDWSVHKNAGPGALLLHLFEETAEQHLVQPTFVTGYPAEASPLARRNDDDAQLTDRFELYIAGREIANGFSELNDPEDQAARFLEQARRKDAGDAEAMHYDADYVQALEHGLPPTAGEGIGVDRLVMLLTDSASIRDVLLFPHLRPQG